jgi:dihydroxy-acid dehydratase
VFRDWADLEARIHRDDLNVEETSVLVLQNAGPLGGPGMPEWGMLPIPKKLLARGVRDMVRISDARMSGTSYGTCVLHVAPESYVGGPLALVRDGDPILLDIPGRKLDLLLPAAELERRRAEWKPPAATPERGYMALYRERVTQAHLGCDFDFASTQPGRTEPAIF